MQDSVHPKEQCTNCGAENDPQNSFCGSCGAPLASSPAGTTGGTAVASDRAPSHAAWSMDRVRSLSTEPKREALLGFLLAAGVSLRLLYLAADQVGYRCGGRAWHGRAGELHRSARGRLVRDGSSRACSFRYRRVLEARSAYHLYCPAPVHSTARGQLDDIASAGSVRSLPARCNRLLLVDPRPCGPSRQNDNLR